MSDKERLQALLDIASLTEEYEALRPKVEGDKQKPEDMARYRELNDEIAAARQAFKEQYPAATADDGDAAPTPASVNAKTKKG